MQQEILDPYPNHFEEVKRQDYFEQILSKLVANDSDVSNVLPKYL